MTLTSPATNVIFPSSPQHWGDLGVVSKLKEWHVLQILRDDLKVEFDSMEYWMADMPADFELLSIDTFCVKVVSLDYLLQLYQRGMTETQRYEDEIHQSKLATLKRTYEAFNQYRSGKKG
jgi:hypothetical protein